MCGRYEGITALVWSTENVGVSPRIKRKRAFEVTAKLLSESAEVVDILMNKPLWNWNQTHVLECVTCISQDCKFRNKTKSLGECSSWVRGPIARVPDPDK